MERSLLTEREGTCVSGCASTAGQHSAGASTASASSGSARAASNEGNELAENFVTHKVCKHDTLAGIAVKYNVPVSEIKRFNGLLTETAIYGRDTLLIPTKLMPVGREVQMIFAQIAAGIGRDPVLNEEANLHPASAAAVRVARALHVAGDSPDSPSAVPWWCQCGTCSQEEPESTTCRSRRMSDYGDEPGEVELMIRSRNNSGLGPASGSGPTRMHEQMHRRTRRSGHGSEGEECSGHPAGAAAPSRGVPGGRHPGRSQPGDPDVWLNSHTGGGGLLAVISKALEESSIMQKIKQAATQPALAKPAANLSFANAADGVMNSLRQGLLPKGGVGGGVRGPSSTGADAGGLPCSFPAATAAPTPMKCGKSD